MTKRCYTNIGTKSTAKVFLDTNVAYDLVSKREPFYREAAFLTDLAKAGFIHILVSSGSIVNLIYFAFERHKIPDAEGQLFDFIKTCYVTPTAKEQILNSLRSTFRDKEDAYQYFTALQNHADYFLTRDKQDFRSNKPYILPVLTPLQFEYMLL